jgi:hypothetical protein
MSYNPHWSKSKVCEEIMCSKSLSIGRRHHCRSCGKHVCSDHTVIAAQKFEAKYTAQQNNLYVCYSCAIKFNLFDKKKTISINFYNQEIFCKWINLALNYPRIYKELLMDRDKSVLYRGIAYRGDAYKTYKEIFISGLN